MTRLLARPAWVFVAVLPLVLLGGFAFTQVGSGFMPAIDEGGFVLDYRSQLGAALSETDRLLKQVEKIIQATPDVQTFSRRTGTGLGGGLSEANSGDFFIRLKSTGRRPVDEVMNEIRGKVESQVPGLFVETAQLMEDLIGLRRNADDVSAMLIRAPDGHLFPLNRIATVGTVTGQPEIGKEDLKRMIAVTARIEGRDLGSVMADVKRMMGAAGVVPAGVHVVYGGLYAQQQIAFSGLLKVFAAAAALVFIQLLFIYERFSVAIAIVATSLLSVSAVFIGLWLTCIELNITAMMGMTMVIGIVTEAGIFYFSEEREVEEGRSLHDSTVLAGQPLAVAIISGLVVQLPLVLLAMPAFHVLMRRERTQSAAAGAVLAEG
jgi:multidrug efflux pump subunit AcrB